MNISTNELEFLEQKVNNYSWIKRKPIKILFASDDTLRKLKEDPQLINDDKLFINTDVTMLDLDTFGNKKGTPTADGLEVSKDKGVLLIEAKDITQGLMARLNDIINNSDADLHLDGIVDNRLEEVKRKLSGSISILNRLLKPIEKTLPDNTDICVGLFIDYKLTDVDEFGLTGDIGLMRDSIDEYSETITETMIFTNKRLNEMESLIREYNSLV